MSGGNGGDAQTRCAVHEQAMTQLTEDVRLHLADHRELESWRVVQEELRREVVRELVTTRNAATKASIAAERAADAAVSAVTEVRAVKDRVEIAIDDLARERLEARQSLHSLDYERSDTGTLLTPEGARKYRELKARVSEFDALTERAAQLETERTRAKTQAIVAIVAAVAAAIAAIAQPILQAINK